MWDLRVSNEKNVKQVDESDPITSMENCYFEGGKYILLTTGKSVKIYDSASFNLVKEFKDLSTDLESASLSMDGQFFVTGGLDNCVRLYEFASGKEIGKFCFYEIANELKIVIKDIMVQCML